MTQADSRSKTTNWLIALCVLFALLGAWRGAAAGTMTRATLAPLFPAPLVVGEQSTALPAWPIFRSEAGRLELLGHVFETADLEPIAGYGGKPINLLVAIDLHGNFLDVRLLSQREPIFQSEKGKAQLAAFARQYEGLSLRHRIEIGRPKGTPQRDERAAILSGVTAGTITATAIDRTVLQSASRVALARLDGAAPAAAAPPASPSRERFESAGWIDLVGAGLVRRIELSNRDVERRFAGTPAAGQDAVGTLQPDGVAIDAWFGPASVAQVGRNLLDAAAWRQVREVRDGGHLVFIVFESGRHTLDGQAAGRRAVTARVVLRQGDITTEMTEMEVEPNVRLLPPRSATGSLARARLLRSVAPLTLDPREPLTFVLQVRRDPGDALRRVDASFAHRLDVPDLETWLPAPEVTAWAALGSAASQRAVEMGVLGAGLAVLALLLARQRWLAASRRRLMTVRVAYLAFTLVFIGWLAQGQLTIVSVTSLIEAVRAGQSPAFLLADPVTVLLWAFVLVTLVVWGRGTFCGWLCPFGALQELVSLAAQRLRIRPVRLRARLDRGLKSLKYGVLATLVAGAGASAAWTEHAVEVEPFKTAISLGFDRAWPFVVWAAACVLLSVFVFRGYCRYICPLGAALALFGRLRLWAWIPRRAQCGTPCQTCRHRCAYQAIDPAGAIDYGECFQCLECVEIVQDDHRCLPLIVERRRAGRRIAIHPASAP